MPENNENIPSFLVWSVLCNQISRNFLLHHWPSSAADTVRTKDKRLCRMVEERRSSLSHSVPPLPLSRLSVLQTSQSAKHTFSLLFSSHPPFLPTSLSRCPTWRSRRPCAFPGSTSGNHAGLLVAGVLQQ